MKMCKSKIMFHDNSVKIIRYVECTPLGSQWTGGLAWCPLHSNQRETASIHITLTLSILLFSNDLKTHRPFIYRKIDNELYIGHILACHFYWEFCGFTLNVILDAPVMHRGYTEWHVVKSREDWEYERAMIPFKTATCSQTHNRGQKKVMRDKEEGMQNITIFGDDLYLHYDDFSATISNLVSKLLINRLAVRFKFIGMDF